MSNILRIKRRGSGGAGAPASLANAELAFNEMDDVLYYGKGNNAGAATSIDPIGGKGAVVMLTGDQTIAGNKTFSGTIAGITATMVGLGNVNNTSDANKPVSTATQTALNLKADLASPTFTGTVTIPTPAVDDNSTKAASTAYVLAQVYASNPTMNGTAAAGSAVKWSRGDHVHPIDTSRAPVASPTFTGLVTTPAGTAAQAGGLHITAGPLKTTPIAGDAGGIEFFSDALSIIISTAARKTIAYTDSNITGTAANVTGTVAVLNGGTGATTSGAALTNLGAAPINAPTFTGIPAAATAAVDTNTTQLATTAFVLAQAGAANPVMNGVVAVGTSTRFSRQDHVHPSDTSKANLASPTFTGVPAAPTAAVDTNTTQVATTAFVLAQAASAATTALGVSAVGTSTRFSRADHVHAMPVISALGVATADVAMGGFKITGLGTPTQDTDAATKGYVDAARAGLDVKASVRLASTAAVTVTYVATAGTSARGQITAAPNTLDSVSLAANDRILLKDQTNGAQNGIWVVTTVGTGANGVWDRSTDFDTDADVTAGAFTFVAEGSVNADSGWVMTTNDPIVIGGSSGTSLAFAQFSGAGSISAGAGLTKTGNTIDVIGTTNRIQVNADNIDISASYAGQSSITTVGALSSGSLAAGFTAVGVAQGGTGATTLTGYVKGNGTGAFTAGATIPNTDITGLGTMATQAASSVAITGGSIINLTTFDGITIDGGSF